MEQSLKKIKMMSEIFANIQTGIKQNAPIEKEIETGLTKLSQLLNHELSSLSSASQTDTPPKK
ncbi:hypothetical protein [Pedobacter sp. MW01-1-1]|uniref:hypothetical protein n=1 Tax=Pedobacter sp. MW01-1-1 TaxID=3383027 RepID=UPI003FF1043F